MFCLRELVLVRGFSTHYIFSNISMIFSHELVGASDFLSVTYFRSCKKNTKIKTDEFKILTLLIFQINVLIKLISKQVNIYLMEFFP